MSFKAHFASWTNSQIPFLHYQLSRSPRGCLHGPGSACAACFASVALAGAPHPWLAKKWCQQVQLRSKQWVKSASMCLMNFQAPLIKYLPTKWSWLQHLIHLVPFQLTLPCTQLHQHRPPTAFLINLLLAWLFWLQIMSPPRNLTSELWWT